MSADNQLPQVQEILAELLALDQRMEELDWSEGTLSEREAIGERENELFGKLNVLVPDELERKRLVATTYSDSEAREEYEHLYINYPAREDESHLAHLRRALGVEATEEFIEGLRWMKSNGTERE